LDRELTITTAYRHGHVESRMRGDTHVRFGGRAGETDRIERPAPRPGPTRPSATTRPGTGVSSPVGRIPSALLAHLVRFGDRARSRVLAASGYNLLRLVVPGVGAVLERTCEVPPGDRTP